MANRPISIEFVADVAQFLKGARGVEVSIEDVADALMAASNDAKDLERKMSRAMKDAEKDVEGLERVIKDLPKATEKAADAADKDFDRIGDDARDAGREVGDEFRQNLGEALSSGNLEDIVSDTLGGLVGSMSGPLAAPAVAGAAIAAYMWTAFKENEEARREATTSIFEMFDEVTGELDRRSLLAASYEQLGGTKDQGLRDAAKYAAALSISTAEYAELIMGVVNPGTQSQLDKLREIVRKGDELTSANISLSGEQKKQYDAAVETLRVAELQAGAMEDAAAASATWQAATAGTGANLEQITEDAQTAAGEVAKIGTGNEALDALVQKAADIGIEALSADEKLTIMGSDNTALDPLKRKMIEMALAAEKGKQYLGEYPDPALKELVAAVQTSKDGSGTILQNLKDINALKLNPKTLAVRVDFTDQGGRPVTPFLPQLG